jgi:hypothetical protein
MTSSNFWQARRHQTSHRSDDFTDPWKPSAVVLVHPRAALTVHAWVPHLARDYRVIGPFRPRQ